jgi:hypothetical protein
MFYSPNSSSGVQMTGHSHACSRQIEASDLTVSALAMCTQIPGYQEIHAMYRRNGDVRSVSGRFGGDLAGCQDARR